MLKKLLQPVYACYVALTFIVSVLVLVPLFLIISIANSKGSRHALNVLARCWSKIWLLIIGMPVRCSGPLPRQDNYIIVANHISYLDTIDIFSAITWYFRPLGKQEVSAIPLLGYLYRQLTIMVDRDSHHSRAISMRQLAHAVREQGSVLIFPEGTFNETEAPLKDFYDGAFRLAIHTGKNILPVVFPDTVHRWHYSGWWKMWPGQNRAIYLPVVEVAGMTHADVTALKTQVYDVMEKELVKYRRAAPGPLAS